MDVIRLPVLREIKIVLFIRSHNVLYNAYCVIQRSNASQEENLEVRYIVLTVCPRSPDPFYIVTYCINWVKTSSTVYTFRSGT